MKAFSCEFSFSMRVKQSSVNSTGETDPSRNNSLICWIERNPFVLVGNIILYSG